MLLKQQNFFAGEKQWHEKSYPFIRNASSFSSPSISTTTSNNEYDYIIVGGGTAGCPLAATLSQKFNVLMLERGGVPFTNPNVSYLENFHITLADVSPTSASQFFVSSDGVYNSRARVLGGGSSINAGFYTRADPRYLFLQSYANTFSTSNISYSFSKYVNDILFWCVGSR